MLHVIGIGSPFGDDQIGLRLIDELRRSERLQPYLGRGLELHQLDRPGAGLLAQLEGKERVVIIDAVVSGATVGQLHRWADIEAAGQPPFSHSSHGVGLAQTLALGRALALLPPVLTILGVEIEAPHDVSAIPYQSWRLSPRLLTQVEDALLAALFHPDQEIE